MSEKHEVIFIGGPVDGRREIVRHLMDFRRVGIMREYAMPAIDWDKDAGKGELAQVVQYRLVTLAGELGERFHVYAYENIDVMRALLQGYPQERKDSGAL